MNHLLLSNVSPSDTASAAMVCADRLQDFPPHVQTAAVCALFLTLCRVHRANAQDVFTITTNLMADPIAGQREEFRALGLYVENELK